MACIWYGIQGEGRGHAARSRTLVEALRGRGHQVEIFTGGDALDLFPLSEPGVQLVPLLRFVHREGRMSVPLTLQRNLSLVFDLLLWRGSHLSALRNRLRQDRPDLVVSDFEPLLARAARSEGVPLVCVDHQHYLCDEELPRLSQFEDDVDGFLLSLGVPTVAHSPRRVISSFHHFPLRPGRQVLQVGCFLRRAVRDAVPHDEGEILVYVKEPELMRRLAGLFQAAAEVNFRVFAREDVGGMPSNVTVETIDAERFVQRLAACRALMCTAGNQVVGEALYLGKPVLAFPVEGMTEQSYNAMALNASGCGRGVPIRHLGRSAWSEFLASLPDFREAIARRRTEHPDWVDGTRAALGYLEESLPDSTRFSPMT